MKIKKMKFEVKDFILKKSELKPEGPVYTNIERYSLE
jgi:2'-5' RNA ligase